MIRLSLCRLSPFYLCFVCCGPFVYHSSLYHTSLVAYYPIICCLSIFHLSNIHPSIFSLSIIPSSLLSLYRPSVVCFSIFRLLACLPVGCLSLVCLIVPFSIAFCHFIVRLTIVCPLVVRLSVYCLSIYQFPSSPSSVHLFQSAFVLSSPTSLIHLFLCPSIQCPLMCCSSVLQASSKFLKIKMYLNFLLWTSCLVFHLQMTVTE